MGEADSLNSVISVKRLDSRDSLKSSYESFSASLLCLSCQDGALQASAKGEHQHNSVLGSQQSLAVRTRASRPSLPPTQPLCRRSKSGWPHSRRLLVPRHRSTRTSGVAAQPRPLRRPLRLILRPLLRQHLRRLLRLLLRCRRSSPARPPTSYLAWTSRTRLRRRHVAA